MVDTKMRTDHYSYCSSQASKVYMYRRLTNIVHLRQSHSSLTDTNLAKNKKMYIKRSDNIKTSLFYLTQTSENAESLPSIVLSKKD